MLYRSPWESLLYIITNKNNLIKSVSAGVWVDPETQVVIKVSNAFQSRKTSNDLGKKHQRANNKTDYTTQKGANEGSFSYPKAVSGSPYIYSAFPACYIPQKNPYGGK